MGYRVHTLSPEDDTPTGQIADAEINASYDDLDAVKRFAKNVQVVTFEFENVPAATAEAAEQFAPVRPAGSVLHTTQHRLREKTFLATHGFPHAPFIAVRSLTDLQGASAKLGLPAVLKTAGWGYDGKGQIMLKAGADLALAWKSLATDEAVLEGFIDFQCEVSVVAARGIDGAFTHWGVIENAHHNHILDVSVAPARIPPNVHDEAIKVARRAGTTPGRRRPLRRIFRHEVRKTSHQRTRPAPAQLRASDNRRIHDEPVPAAGPRGVQSAAGGNPAAYAGGDGEFTGEFVDVARTGLVVGVVDSRSETASLRKARAAGGTQDGTSHRAGRQCRRCEITRHRSPGSIDATIGRHRFSSGSTYSTVSTGFPFPPITSFR